LTCNAADKVLGPRGQERIEVNETAEAMQIEEPIVLDEPALLPTPRVSFFDHDQQVFNEAFEALERQSPDLDGLVIEWAKYRRSHRFYPGFSRHRFWMGLPPHWGHGWFPEDDLNPVKDWSIRLAFQLTQPCNTETNSARSKLIQFIFENQRLTDRYKFAVDRISAYNWSFKVSNEHYYPPSPQPYWYGSLWGKAMHRLDSAIVTAKESINTVREAVDYASQVLTSFNVYPAEPGNSSDDMQFRLFTNTLNTFDLKSKWTNFESHWERFTGQVTKLGVETKGWPPDSASLGELLDTLRPGFG
jgi:hypothetical protein